MPIKITRPGIFTTVQDLGRIGYRSVGIGPGGVMDFFAASVANFLVGNVEKKPVLEMHFPAAEILFEEDALISITGGDFSSHINDQPVNLWAPILIKKDQKLSFKKFINGARCYLAINGGLHADQWLNSFSTHTKLKAGGFQGRPLRKDDVIFLNKSTYAKTVEKFPGVIDLTNPLYESVNIIRCIPGPEWHFIDEQSQAGFQQQAFSVTTQSDRMGYRLKATALRVQETAQLISSPVDFGTIQLLPDGQLIILMADHQTTGGYPRIANVISADLPKLAQCHITSELRFELTTIENAEEALLSLYQRLESIKNICNDYYDAHRHQL